MVMAHTEYTHGMVSPVQVPARIDKAAWQCRGGEGCGGGKGFYEPASCRKPPWPRTSISTRMMTAAVWPPGGMTLPGLMGPFPV